MADIILSVIIPVYNVDAYLERCVNSVLKQNIYVYEIILVDDGSTDKSGEICDKYSEHYDFIKTIHIPNSGPATAKNKGYELAHGEFISFIDSDDEIKPDMYSSMLKKAKHYNADIVCCSYEQVDEDGKKSHEECTSEVYILNQVEGVKHLLEKNLIYSQCWTKIYRRALLEQYNIRFVDGLKTEEDFIYNLQIFVRSQTIIVIDKPLYIYTHRTSSLSREYFKSHLSDFLKNMIYRLTLTNSEVKEKFPTLSLSCTVHCLQYYNMMIGRAAMFPYKNSIPYYSQACKYIKQHKLILLKQHSKCGFSLWGAALFVLLPIKFYFIYRKIKA